LLLEIDSAGQVMVAAVAEAVRVARAKDIDLPYDDPVAQVRQVALATGSNRSSMLSDVVRRLPTEIDVINGAIVREGERMGLDTPVNQLLVWLVTAIEAGYELQMTRDE
jgi:2-dehydropantoate 2-reductase